MNFAPNVDAMLYFTKSIWPLIKELVPKARMQIVGRSPSPEIHSLQSINGIEIVGEVPDIRPYIKSASVFVCPMRLGSGIKNKLLEAMSSGLPIVSSSSGFSGIEAKDGDNILVADDPSKFAEKVSYLLHDSLLREKLGSGARALIEREYSWSRAAKKYAALYESLVAKQTLKIKNESP
jgi:glycosyltransferase involved in cell wall biosynthesis